MYPALAVAEVLRERSATPPELLFVGTRGRLEERVVPQNGIPLAFVASRPLERRLSPALLGTLASNLTGVLQALRVVGRFQPDCVVATGGYVAFPVVLAARLLRTFGRVRSRIVALEPNATAGLTNRLLAPLVDEVWTEAPVRAAILRPHSPQEARRALGLDPDKTTVVVMGGSQGARRINDAVVGAARQGLVDGLQLLLVSGERDLEQVQAAGVPANVTVVAYLDDPGLAYAAADLVVARAGASTLAELRATATPSILVPYPHAAADHQSKNARKAAQGGSARVVPDAELDAARLGRELHDALAPEHLTLLREAARRYAAFDAREHVFQRIDALARG